jgi:hypothetical protein
MALFTPLAAQIFRFAPPGKLSEATSSPFPDFDGSAASLTAAGKALASGWLDKNFPFRGQLIRWYNFASASMFGSYSHKAPVAVGKDGWLFLAKDRTIDVLAEHQAVVPLTGAQLDTLTALYEERRAWLAERGVKYLLVVAPNKNSIYPELLPAEFKQIGPVSRLDQIMKHLAGNSSIEVLDLRQTLLEAKKSRQVFYATDSHWNAHGAFPCYQAVVGRLAGRFPALKPLAASDFLAMEFTFLGGDLSYMVGLEDLVTERKVAYVPITPFKARGVSTGTIKPGYAQPSQASEVNDPKLPKAVFFHDSYFWEILSLLGEHFSRAVYVWVKPGLAGSQSFFDKELVEAEKPDVVVEQIAERFFLPAAVKTPSGAGEN